MISSEEMRIGQPVSMVLKRITIVYNKEFEKTAVLCVASRRNGDVLFYRASCQQSENQREYWLLKSASL